MELALGASDGMKLALGWVMVSSQIRKPGSKNSSNAVTPQGGFSSPLSRTLYYKPSPQNSILLCCSSWRDGSSPPLTLPPCAVANSVISTTEDADFSEVEAKMLTALKERRTEDAWQFNQVLRRRGVLPSKVCLSRLVAQLSFKGTPSSLARAQSVLVHLQKLEKLDLLDANSLGVLVTASARAGAGRYALSILRILLQTDGCPPVKVWSAVVSCLGKHPCDAPLALELFDDICNILALDSNGESSASEIGKEGGVEPRPSSSRGTHLESVNEKRRILVSGMETRADTGAFNAALNSCATAGLAMQAEKLLERMSVLEVPADLFTFNILIKLFTKVEDIDQLLDIMQKMQELGVEPDLSTYNSLVSSYVSLGELDEAERLVRTMQKGPGQPKLRENAGSKLFDGSSHEEGEEPEMAKVAQGVEKSMQKEESTEDVAEGLQRVMRSDESAEVVGEVKNRISRQFKPPWKCTVRPNVRTYTTLMKGYVKNGRMKDAVQLLIAMQNQDDSRSHPNEVTYTTVISACVNMGLMDEAKGILVEMVAQKVPANLITYNILLKGYCNAGRISMAYEMMDDMRKAGLSPDVVSYNTLINGCIQRDDNLGALEVFKEMRRAGIAPSEISYTTLMNAFARNGQPKLVDEVFREMQMDSWMRVDVIAWNVLIDGYCRAGLMAEAKQCFNNMKVQGFHPSVATYGCLVKGFATAGQAGEALVLWNEIQERTMAKKGDEIEPLVPDGGLLDCLVDTCVRAGFFQKALEVVACMEGQGILADKTKYKRMFIELYSTLYTSKHASAGRIAKTADKRRAVDAFKFWLGLPNEYYQSDWRP